MPGGSQNFWEGPGIGLVYCGASKGTKPRHCSRKGMPGHCDSAEFSGCRGKTARTLLFSPAAAEGPGHGGHHVFSLPFTFAPYQNAFDWQKGVSLPVLWLQRIMGNVGVGG